MSEDNRNFLIWLIFEILLWGIIGGCQYLKVRSTSWIDIAGGLGLLVIAGALLWIIRPTWSDDA